MSREPGSDEGEAQQGEDSVLADTLVASHDTRRRGPAGPRLERLARYQILGPIGEGGFGTVYAARDPMLDRKVAIKLLHRRGIDQLSADVSVERRMAEHRAQRQLLREATALAYLSHPNIVSIYDAGTFEYKPEEGDEAASAASFEAVFVVMELIDGLTLGRWLKEAPRSWREIVEVFLGAGRGLAAAHAKGFVHHDFKPANVLVSHQGRVKVLDFGLARAVTSVESGLAADVEPSSSAPASAGATTTHTSRVRGTPAFMAPEQHLRTTTGPFTDQFSFCLALFEALYGRSPFPGDSPVERISNMLRGARPRPPGDRELPAWIEPLLRKGLAFRPHERHLSMLDLIGKFERELARADAAPAPVEITAATMPARVYELDTTSAAEAEAIRECVRIIEPHIVLYWELVYPTVYAISLMRERLDELAADGEPYAIITDLTRCSLMPTVGLAVAIRTMFRDAHLVDIRVVTDDAMANLAASFVLDPICEGGGWTLHRSREEAIEQARGVLARVLTPPGA